MRITHALLVLATLGIVPTLASAQRVPFFGAAGNAFDPEISVVNSGEILDAQAVVSGDMKYVTINTRASSTELLALRDFTFVGSGVRRGNVGGAGGNDNGGGAGGGANGAPARRGVPAIGRDDDDEGPANGQAAAAAAAPRGRRGRAEKRDRAPAARVERAARAERAAGARVRKAGILDQPGMTLVGRFRD